MVRARLALERVDTAQIGLLFVALAAVVYVFSNPTHMGWHNHFVWQADAFLQGRFAITYPVAHGPYVNAYFHDVMPLSSGPGMPSYGLLPFPPLPAVLLMPLVALFGLGTDAQLFGAVLGAINVGLAWRMVSRLTEQRAVAVLATLFFAFGTVHWYAAMLSTTWFLAHVVATTLVLLGITIALDGERREQLGRSLDIEHLSPLASSGARNQTASAIADSSRGGAGLRWLRTHLDGLQFVAGLVFGFAMLARLTTIFGAPFFVFVGGGGSYRKRALSAALGAVIPLVLLALYNLASTGHVFNPVYEWLHQTEELIYVPPGIEFSREWGIEDLRHIPGSLMLMFAWPPSLFPNGTECGLSLLKPDCPIAVPSPYGMSLLLSSPAYLLAVPVAVAGRHLRLTLGATLAVVSIALVNLAHFSQGWVQFGYRFSNDFAPFALILITLTVGRLGVRKLTIGLVTASILVNAWGVYWGVVLRW